MTHTNINNLDAKTLCCQIPFEYPDTGSTLSTQTLLSFVDNLLMEIDQLMDLLTPVTEDSPNMSPTREAHTEGMVILRKP